MIGTCSCFDLVKGTKRRRKLRGATKEYLEWLDREAPSFAEKLYKEFVKEAERTSRKVVKVLGLGKAKPIGVSIVDTIDWTDLESVMYGIFTNVLGPSFRQQAKEAFAVIGVDASDAMLAVVNEGALDYAKQRGAELVGMKYNKNGDLVKNPDSKYSITEVIRAELRDLIGIALDDGWTSQMMAQEIVDGYAFSRARSETIARTELAFAHVQGNLTSWKASGVVDRKQWVLGSEHDLDDVCDGNAEAGVIGIDEEFPSGHQAPPAHPRCVCDLVPVLKKKGKR
jgi:D-arabinose 5-phosphate isomerase GutQ